MDYSNLKYSSWFREKTAWRLPFAPDQQPPRAGAEQPFTRQLTGISIPDHVDQVRVRGHDLVHNYGGVEKTVAVPRPTKPS